MLALKECAEVIIYTDVARLADAGWIKRLSAFKCAKVRFAESTCNYWSLKCL